MYLTGIESRITSDLVPCTTPSQLEEENPDEAVDESSDESKLSLESSMPLKFLKLKIELIRFSRCKFDFEFAYKKYPYIISIPFPVSNENTAFRQKVKNSLLA